MCSRTYYSFVFFLFCFYSGLQASNTAIGISELFTLDVRPPDVTIISPDAGEQFSSSLPVQVSWTAYDDNMGENPISINLVIKPADESYMLAENIDNTGSTQVNMPLITTNKAIIRVYATDLYGNTGQAQTTGYISISDGTINITNPELTYENILNVYPNPAANKVWIEYQKTSQAIHTISLININGQVLSSENIHHTGTVKTSFPLDGLTSGLYLIKLDYHSGFTVNKFLVR